MRFRQAILRVNGKPHLLQPNRANTFEEIYADFQQGDEGNGLRYSVFLHPKENVLVQGLEIQFDLSLPPEARFFANGYQSWSESRLLRPDEGIPRLRRMARGRLGWSGDTHIAGIPRGRGHLHSWTYTYLTQPGRPTRFLGSINERTGFTLFLYDQASGTLTVRKDMDALKLQHSFPALDFWMAEGEERALFDAYFNICELSVPTAPMALGWTSGSPASTALSEAKLLQNLDSFAELLAETAQFPEITPSKACFQVDDGWQTAVGDWHSVSPAFPGGMGKMAWKIREKGLEPGLWLAPFVVGAKSELLRRHPEWLLKDAKGRALKAGWNPAWGGWFYALDFYQDGVREYLSGVFHTMLDKWGYEWLKLDYLFVVALAPPPGKTRGGVMWEAMEFLRQLTGSRRFLAAGVPLGACFGLADYCRIDGNLHPQWEHRMHSFLRHRERADTLASLRSALGRWQLHGRAFLNVSDQYVLRTQLQRLNPVQQQTLLTLQALLSGVWLSSDEVGHYSEAQKEEWVEARSLRGSRVKQVLELEPDVWKIEFEQANESWYAYSNLCAREKQLLLPNGRSVELRSYETLILKS